MLEKWSIIYKRSVEIIIYIMVLAICIFHDAIYSPDTPSYINANIFRSPGYPIFVRIIKVISQDYFNFFIVLIQTSLGLFAVYTFSSIVQRTFRLNFLLRIFLILLLIFPFLAPLQVANNISSEGLSYPIYLFFLSLSLNFLFLKKNTHFFYLIICSILLALTRGQFLILPVVLAIVYFLKNKAIIFNRAYFIKFIILLVVPLGSILLDKSYHKIKDGLFISTPFTYINATASALYISTPEDANSFENKDTKIIFKDCYAFISKNKWLLSSEDRINNVEDYEHFHKNLGKICNLTLHERGTTYYLNQNKTIVEARYLVEKTAKNMFFTLVTNNFKEWIRLFYSNLIHGFKHHLVLFFILSITILSAVYTFKSANKYVYILLFLSALILSNALVVAFASHSIMRYLFYNYSLFFLILVSIFKFIKDVRKN